MKTTVEAECTQFQYALSGIWTATGVQVDQRPTLRDIVAVLEACAGFQEEIVELSRQFGRQLSLIGMERPAYSNRSPWKDLRGWKVLEKAVDNCKYYRKDHFMH